MNQHSIINALNRLTQLKKTSKQDNGHKTTFDDWYINRSDDLSAAMIVNNRKPLAHLETQIRANRWFSANHLNLDHAGDDEPSSLK